MAYGINCSSCGALLQIVDNTRSKDDKVLNVHFCPFCNREFEQNVDFIRGSVQTVRSDYKILVIRKPNLSHWDNKYEKKENIENKDNLKYLYHATYLPLLESIKKIGLGGTTQTYWEDSKPGVVYLSTDKDVAISYAEANENVPDDWLDSIVVITIEFDKLDPNYLEIDENVQDNEGVTLEYHKIIPSSLFYDIQQDE